MFTITIQTGNAAMNSAEDVADALRACADQLRGDSGPLSMEGAVRDVNGNTVGHWELDLS